MENNYVLLVKCVPTGHIYARETFKGTFLDADRRLSDLWNQHCAWTPNRGNKATLRRKGERRSLSTIQD